MKRPLFFAPKSLLLGFSLRKEDQFEIYAGIFWVCPSPQLGFGFRSSTWGPGRGSSSARSSLGWRPDEAYDFQSQGVVEMLEKLQVKFSEEKEALETLETSKKSSHQQVMDSLAKQARCYVRLLLRLQGDGLLYIFYYILSIYIYIIISVSGR